jgi:hypothetical protein
MKVAFDTQEAVGDDDVVTRRHRHKGQGQRRCGASPAGQPGSSAKDHGRGRRSLAHILAPQGEDLSKFVAFSQEMTSFMRWATNGLKEWQRLWPGESLADARSNRPVAGLEAAPATGEVS